jgi:predicted CXXCH cytochrome family protein
MGACTACHNPHSSQQEYFLRLSPTELCSTCHADTASRPHLISGFNGEGHPVKAKTNPADPTQAFSCASCHNPHASENSMLLNFGGKKVSLKNFCTNCHLM